MRFWDVYFPDYLDIRKYIGGEFTLLADFSCEWVDPEEDTHYRLTAPKGFRTDLSSIPKWARSLISVVGDQDAASVIHDWLYVKQGAVQVMNREEGVEQPMFFPRKQVDQLFYQGLRTRQIGWFKARIMYLAVRLGGGKAWRT